MRLLKIGTSAFLPAEALLSHCRFHWRFQGSETEALTPVEMPELHAVLMAAHFSLHMDILDDVHHA